MKTEPKHTMTSNIVSARPHPTLERHPGFQRLFQPGKLSIGLILPLETHRGKPAPTMQNHVEMAQRADELDFGALWMRDVPFYDPEYGDVAQIFESLTYIAYLAAFTRRIALGTTGIVLPTHEPTYLAKQATSLDHLSDGRLVLGLSSGDRHSDYPMLGIDFDSRGERYRDAWSVFRTLTEEDFPSFTSTYFGASEGKLNLVPRPSYGRIPSIGVGRSQQSTEWLAHNLDGLLAFAPKPDSLEQVSDDWYRHVQLAAGEEVFKPLAMGSYLDLSDDPNESFRRIPGGFRAGRQGLLNYLERARAAGITHAALNPKVSRQPYEEILQELAEYVLPHFPSHE